MKTSKLTGKGPLGGLLDTPECSSHGSHDKGKACSHDDDRCLLNARNPRDPAYKFDEEQQEKMHASTRALFLNFNKNSLNTKRWAILHDQNQFLSHRTPLSARQRNLACTSDNTINIKSGTTFLESAA